MKKSNYNTSSHCIYLCQYHLVWCPKFRYGVLTNDIAKALKQVFNYIATEYNYQIIEMEIMPDHVHLFVGASPSVSPNDMIRIFKSISAIKIFQQFDNIKQYYSKCGSLWSRGKFISTIGFVSVETIKKYIQDQKDNQ